MFQNILLRLDHTDAGALLMFVIPDSKAADTLKHGKDFKKQGAGGWVGFETWDKQPILQITMQKSKRVYRHIIFC